MVVARAGRVAARAALDRLDHTAQAREAQQVGEVEQDAQPSVPRALVGRKRLGELCDLVWLCCAVATQVVMEASLEFRRGMWQNAKRCNPAGIPDALTESVTDSDDLGDGLTPAAQR